MTCPVCGGEVVAAVRESGNILWECCECEYWIIEHVQDITKY